MPSKYGFIFLSACLLSLTARAEVTSPRCYLFKPGSVEAVEHPEASKYSDAETWCYQDVTVPQPGRLIYMVTPGGVKPELSLFVSDDGYLTHNSLVAGKIKTFKVKASSFNPFPVPLNEPDIATRFSLNLSKKTLETSQANLSNLLSAAQEDISVSISEGVFKAQASHLPWRGYWFPQRGQTIGPSLKKYDTYVKAKTGVNPNSANYERNHHAYSGEVWEGHCNGWAAAAILNKEPVSSKTDARSGVTFSVLDLKALVTERDYCVTHTFYGSRYRAEGDNLSDIRPAEFHKALVYYIGHLKKAVATDYDRAATVNNAVISGYDMTITKTASRTYKVITVVSLHHYDKKKSEQIGVAPFESKRYSYTIRVNDSGDIIGGSWLSGNPDFVWVPLSSTPCSKNNQKLDYKEIEQILNM